MKILITTDLFTTETNGVVTSVKNLYIELKRKGHDVRILTLSDSICSHKENSVYYIRSMPIGVYPDVRMPLSYRHSLIQELIDWEPDIIHSQCEIFSMQYANRISKMTGAPIIHTYHTMYEEYVGYVIPGKRLGKWVVRYLTNKRLEKVARVIVPSEKMVKVLTDYELDKPIQVIPSGIALEQHKERISKRKRRTKRTQLGILDDQTVLINLGRLGTEKNLDELLHVFAKARKNHKELVLMIVGDGPVKEKLEKKAKSMGIGKFVVFTGMVNPEEVQDYYQLGDIFVSASTSETQGLTYIEAAANGLPLLCKQDPCLEGVIYQGENGYEYTCEADFLNALDMILTDDDWRIAAEKRSKEIATMFDRETFGSAVEEAYKSIL